MNAEKLTVYGYGVKPLFGGPNGEHFQEMDNGTIVTWKPYAFIHYWIDEKLKYHECVKETAEMPECLFMRNSKIRVELNGPMSYTVNGA